MVRNGSVDYDAGGGEYFGAINRMTTRIFLPLHDLLNEGPIVLPWIRARKNLV